MNLISSEDRKQPRNSRTRRALQNLRFWYVRTNAFQVLNNVSAFHSICIVTCSEFLAATKNSSCFRSDNMKCHHKLTRISAQARIMSNWHIWKHICTSHSMRYIPLTMTPQTSTCYNWHFWKQYRHWAAWGGPVTASCYVRLPCRLKRGLDSAGEWI